MSERPGTLGVVGAGTMGAGIAQVALEAGWTVRLHDAVPSVVERAWVAIESGLRRGASKRELPEAEAEAWISEWLGRLTAAPTVADLAAGGDLVIEAAIEDLGEKRAIFGELDRVAAPGTILATNTSALSVSAIAEAATIAPGRVLGLHFFNPAPVLRLVEVVAGLRTAPAALERATAIVAEWGKTPVRSTDSPGFIVNRVNRPFTIEALRMLEAGEASVGDIDAAMRATGFPMGPFELMDLVGLDVNLAAATAIWEGLGRPERLRPSPVQAWLVEQGRLGRKSGAGFYRRDPNGIAVPVPLPVEVATSARNGAAPAAIADRIRAAIAKEAILARDAGVASQSDIETALALGAAYPGSPFSWGRGSDPTIPA